MKESKQPVETASQVETIYGDEVHIVVRAQRHNHVLAGLRCSCRPDLLDVLGRWLVTHR